MDGLADGDAVGEVEGLAVGLVVGNALPIICKQHAAKSRELLRVRMLMSPQASLCGGLGGPGPLACQWWVPGPWSPVGALAGHSAWQSHGGQCQRGMPTVTYSSTMGLARLLCMAVQWRVGTRLLQFMAATAKCETVAIDINRV